MLRANCVCAFVLVCLLCGLSIVYPQARFTEEFSALVHRSLSLAESGSTPITSQSKIGRSKQQWRDWIMSTFENYTKRVSGNELVNLVAGASPHMCVRVRVCWCGASECLGT